MIEHLYPRLGLLGGSPSTTEGKVSKLAALAAARRKKEPEKTGEGQSKQHSNSVALLDTLNASRKAEVKNDTMSTTASDSLSEDSKINNENTMPGQTRRYPLRRKESPTRPSEIPEEPPEENEPETQQAQDSTLIQANPSMFAKTVLGDQAKETPLGMLHTDFNLPYVTDPSFTKSTAFTGPSPDDIVNNAQAKGAAYAGKKTIKS